MLKTKEIILRSNSAEETKQIGRILASQITAGDVIALTADLGGGKTTLTQGICDGLHVEEYVTSPTFTIIQEYQGDIPVAHFDFYRMQSVEEIEDLGLDMYINPQTLCIIEWAERGEAVLPEEIFRVHLSLVFEKDVFQENVRRIDIQCPAHRLIKGLDTWLFSE